MAQFYGTVQGNRGEATRLGSKASGIIAEARGWDIGAQVRVDHEDGKDVVRVWKTSGSNGRRFAELIAEFTADEDRDLA